MIVAVYVLNETITVRRVDRASQCVLRPIDIRTLIISAASRPAARPARVSLFHYLHAFRAPQQTLHPVQPLGMLSYAIHVST